MENVGGPYSYPPTKCGCGIKRSGVSGKYTCSPLPDVGSPDQPGYANHANFPVNCVLNAFVDFTMQELSRAEALVWLALYRDTKDGTAQTSQSDIARRAGENVRTVKRAIAGLHRRGLLVLVHRGSLRRGPSTYRLPPLTTRKER
jgi:hypothetical protein